jgi:tetratricopeptide (TPR) repeat protein
VRRPSGRQLLGLGAIWAAVSIAAFGIASALDDPVGAGPRDEARPIIAGPIVAPGQELTGRDDGLPPLALVLDRPLSAEILSLAPRERVVRLREIAATSADPRRLVELGAAHQQVGDTPAAEAAYRDALRLESGNLEARIGLEMARAATGSAGQDEAAAALDELAKEAPSSQIVHFNRAWLDIYRRRPDPALQGFALVVRLGPGTDLGRTAQELIDAIGGESDGASADSPPSGG